MLTSGKITWIALYGDLGMIFRRWLSLRRVAGDFLVTEEETMDRRHSDMLNSRLEEILTKRCTYISWNELYLWYGAQKLAAMSYRDLEERLQEISAGKTMQDGD